jgi:hypothetical protein
MKVLTTAMAALALAAGTALSQQPAAEAPKSEAPKKAAQKPHTVSKGMTARVTAEVADINYETREVTLKTPEKSWSVVAGPEIKRLKEVKKGDTVDIEYHVGLMAEAREATPDEKANPTQAVAAKEALGGGAPAGAMGHAVKVVATVESIDKAKHTVTFKGPEGHSETIEAEHPENLDKIKVGDTVVFTYAEAIAMAVTPAKKTEAPKEPAKK